MKYLIFLLVASLPFLSKAQTNLSNNLQPNTPKHVDNRTGKFASGVWRPYVDTAEANASINQFYRYNGLTVQVGTPTAYQDYWYYGGVNNSDLVLKSPQLKTVNGNSLLGTGNIVISGGGATDSLINYILTGNSNIGNTNVRLSYFWSLAVDTINTHSTIVNSGVSGSNIKDMLNNFSSRVAANIVAGKKNIVVTNLDYSNSFLNSNPAVTADIPNVATFNALCKQFCDQVKALGATVITATGLPNNGYSTGNNNPYIDSASRMWIDTAAKYGYNCVDLRNTRVGKFHNMYSNSATPENVALQRDVYEDNVHMNGTSGDGKGSKIFVAAMSAKVFNVVYKTPIPDLQNYLYPYKSQGEVVQWDRTLNIIDSVSTEGALIGTSSTNDEINRARGFKVMAASGNKVVGRIELVVNAPCFAGILPVAADTADFFNPATGNPHYDMQVLVKFKSDGNVQFKRSFQDKNIIGFWNYGDQFSIVYFTDKTVVYKNGNYLGMYNADAPTFPAWPAIVFGTTGLGAYDFRVQRNN